MRVQMESRRPRKRLAQERAHLWDEDAPDGAAVDPSILQGLSFDDLYEDSTVGREPPIPYRALPEQTQRRYENMLDDMKGIMQKRDGDGDGDGPPDDAAARLPPNHFHERGPPVPPADALDDRAACALFRLEAYDRVENFLLPRIARCSARALLPAGALGQFVDGAFGTAGCYRVSVERVANHLTLVAELDERRYLFAAIVFATDRPPSGSPAERTPWCKMDDAAKRELRALPVRFVRRVYFTCGCTSG